MKSKGIDDNQNEEFNANKPLFLGNDITYFFRFPQA